VRETGRANVIGNRLKPRSIPDLFLDDTEPPKPFAFVGIRPERSITGPKSLHFVPGFPIGERGIHRFGKISRQTV
jgi:hypothetical protein